MTDPLPPPMTPWTRRRQTPPQAHRRIPPTVFSAAPLRPSFLFPRVLLLLSVCRSTAATSALSPEIRTGTTILAARYRDGVVIGCDTRTSVSGYVSNKAANKVAFVLDGGRIKVPVTFLASRPAVDEEAEAEAEFGDPGEDLEEAEAATAAAARWGAEHPASTAAVLRSGSSADTQSLADACRRHLLRRSVVDGRKSTVSDVAYLLRTMIRNDPDVGASLVVAGWDPSPVRAEDNGGGTKGKGVIFSVSPGGSLMEEKCGWAVGGSGSRYILGYIDAHYPHGCWEEWEEEQAVEFVERCVSLAMERDGSSGGMVRIWIVDGRGRRAEVRTPRSLSAFSSSSAKDWPNGVPAEAAQLDGFAPPSRAD